MTHKQKHNKITKQTKTTQTQTINIVRVDNKANKHKQ